MAAQHGQDTILEVEGRQAQAYISGADQASAPGVLVLHAWWGLTPFFKQLCDRLAGAGFVALAVNLYGDKTAQTIDEARVLMQQEERDYEWIKAVGLAALDRLRAAAPGGGLGIVGFSMGAYWASGLSTLRPDDTHAVVLFYGTGGVDFTLSRADFLGHFAESDDYEPLDGIQKVEAEMRAAGLSVTFHVYPGTGHWFFEDNRPDAYNAQAAGLAWGRTISFLEERLT
jgi:carboxymethylenebutenolidase